MSYLDSKGKLINRDNLNFIKEVFSNSLISFEHYIENNNNIGNESKKTLEKNIANYKKHFYEALAKGNDSKTAFNIEHFMDKFIEKFQHEIIDDITDNNDKKHINNILYQINGQLSENKYNYYNNLFGFHVTESNFKLPTTPINGIEHITNVNDSNDQSLYKLFPKYDTFQENNSAFGAMLTACMYANSYKNLFKKNRTISINNIYANASIINNSLSNHGNFEKSERGEMSKDNEKPLGIGVGYIPMVTYNIFSNITNCMNEINKVKNANLKKTQAVALASYAYSMINSTKPFAKENEKTARIFADSILLSFNLPPHTPTPAEKELVANMGDKIDFNHATKVYFEGLKLSASELDKSLNWDELLKAKEENKINPIVKPNKKPEKTEPTSEFNKYIKKIMNKTLKTGKLINSDAYSDVVNALKNYTKSKDTYDIKKLLNIVNVCGVYLNKKALDHKMPNRDEWSHTSIPEFKHKYGKKRFMEVMKLRDMAATMLHHEGYSESDIKKSIDKTRTNKTTINKNKAAVNEFTM